jgi:hypothetical protein
LYHKTQLETRWYLVSGPDLLFTAAPPIAISPPQVPAVDASHGHEIFPARPDADKDQSLSRMRNPHAVSYQPSVFIDRIRSRHVSFKISKHLPLNFFSFPPMVLLLVYGKEAQQSYGEGNEESGKSSVIC